MFFKSNNTKLDSYVSLGVGYSYRVVDFKENGVSQYDANSDLQKQVNLIPLSLRTAFGIKYYPTRNIGFNAEIGLGGPLLSVGAVFRFNQKY